MSERTRGEERREKTGRTSFFLDRSCSYLSPLRGRVEVRGDERRQVEASDDRGVGRGDPAPGGGLVDVPVGVDLVPERRPRGADVLECLREFDRGRS